MLDAFALGVLAQSSLLLAACWVRVPTRLVGVLAGFGAGAMISAIAFDLVPEATEHIAEWLAMLTNSLMLFAFERGKQWAGAATVVGFCLTMLNT